MGGGAVVQGRRLGWGELRIGGYRAGSEDHSCRTGGVGERPQRLPGRSRPPRRGRTPAGGKNDPTIEDDLKKLVEPETGGDATGKRTYVKSSLRSLAERLGRVSYRTVGRLLKKAGYSLKTNVKRLTGPPHPDRDRQFRFLRKMRAIYLRRGAPVISVDTKNSELIGNFNQKGRRWRRKPDEVNAHDFPGDAECRAIPYGIYDITFNRGHVCVGTTADTSEFAVHSIRDWWLRFGRRRYPEQTHLLIEADSGGSNGCRPRLWKRELQRLANETGLTITVCHYPRGASKWNPADHRLFGPISRNWAGTPLRDLPTMLGYIRGTKTQTGLRVTARLDQRTYARKIKVSDHEMKQLNLKTTRSCSRWNYTIAPQNSGSN